MKKHILSGVFTLLLCAIAAVFTSCESENEPHMDSNVKLISFSWDEPDRIDHDFPMDSRFLTVDYSVESRTLSLVVNYLNVYTFDGYKTLVLTEGNVLSIGFAETDVFGGGVFPDSLHKITVKWELNVEKSGNCLIRIYDLGCSKDEPAKELFQNVEPVVDVELALGSDLKKTIEFGNNKK